MAPSICSPWDSHEMKAGSSRCLLMWCTSVLRWQRAAPQPQGLLLSKPALYVYFSHMTFSYIFVGIGRTQIAII